MLHQRSMSNPEFADRRPRVHGLTRWIAGRLALARAGAAVALLLVVAACGPDAPALPPLAKNATVLAFGDSLTHGTGTARQHSYPAILEQIIGRRVVSAGVPGEVSAKGLERLRDVLDEEQPDLLVLCHGGNDFLRRMNRRKAEANIRAMVKLARSRGIPVVLIGVPAPGFRMTEGAGLYARIAEDHALPYDGKTLAKILGNPRLKSDMVHPNAKGYQKLAEAVAGLLRQSGAI